MTPSTHLHESKLQGSLEAEDGDGMPKSEKIRECGRFDFKDGFKYSGEVDGEEMMAHGHGVLIGPSGTYAGVWSQGMQTVGVYTWYVGAKYEGTWEKGKRHGYGVERRARWVYEGEWKDDKKTGYGVLRSHRGATFEGTWLESTQDGYGVETYADGGFYIGQWYRGMRQGYGVRVVNPKITPRDMLNVISTLAQAQHGLGVQDKKSVWNIKNFPLQNNTEDAGVPQIRVSVDHDDHEEDDRFESEKPEKQRIQNNGTKHPPPMEVYRGEWKNDKRSGYGVLETCTGMKYEGEWLNNFRSGYGVLNHKDGRQESGKWKQNRRQFVKKHCWSSTVKSFSVEVQRAMQAATHAGKEAERKSLTALQRIEGARREGESARLALEQARQHCKLAKQKAKSAAQKPLRRKGVRRGFRFCSDDSNSNDSDSRSRIPSNSSVSADESPEDLPEVKPKKTHPDNLSRITEQNSFDHSDYHSGPEDGDQENNLPHIIPEMEHRTEAASIKLPAIDESSECGSARSYSSFVYRNVEKSICGAAKTPVLISPLARNIVQLREVKMSRSGAGTPCRPGSTTSSVASSCPSRPLHSKSHQALLGLSPNETAQLERMDSVEI